MRYASRVDNNHSDIVKAFRNLGWTVADTSRAGAGFPDLVIGKTGTNLLIEIKDGDKPWSAQKLTKAQQDFHRAWRGPLEIVRNLNDVVAVDKRWRFIAYNQRSQKLDGLGNGT
jgi:Holliday junction resolvase